MDWESGSENTEILGGGGDCLYVTVCVSREGRGGGEREREKQTNKASYFERRFELLM